MTYPAYSLRCSTADQGECIPTWVLPFHTSFQHLTPFHVQLQFRFHSIFHLWQSIEWSVSLCQILFPTLPLFRHTAVHPSLTIIFLLKLMQSFLNCQGSDWRACSFWLTLTTGVLVLCKYQRYLENGCELVMELIMLWPSIFEDRSYHTAVTMWSPSTFWENSTTNGLLWSCWQS